MSFASISFRDGLHIKWAHLHVLTNILLQDELAMNPEGMF